MGLRTLRNGRRREGLLDHAEHMCPLAFEHRHEPPELEPEQLDPVRLKQGLPAPLSAALHCGMLTEGVHLFHGSGFVSTEHSDADLERTVSALAATLPRLQAAGLA